MQYYAEIHANKYFDFQSRLNYLKHVEMPSATPLDATDERLEVVTELKREYLALVDEIFNRHKEYTDKRGRLDKLTEIVDTFGSDMANQYVPEIERLIAKFEETECLDEFKVSMNDQLAKFQKLRSVLCMDDIGEKYMCFTCLERSVDTFLDPCGHMACSVCQMRFGTSCPFCRVMVTPKRMFLG
jgi:hypothetical protein